MKQLLVLCVAIVFLSSCHNYKQDVEKLKIEKDSISYQAAVKDSSIVEYLNDFNEILTTLDSIKKIEKLVTVKSARGKEMNYRQKKLI